MRGYVPRPNCIRGPRPGSDAQLSLFLITHDDIESIEDQMDLWVVADIVYQQHGYKADPTDNLCDIAQTLRESGRKPELAALVEAMEKRMWILRERDLARATE